MRLRLRLALWYAALFAVCGAVLLAVAYRVVSASVDAYGRDVAAVVKRGERELQRRERARGIPVTPTDPRAAPLSQAQRTIRADAQRAARLEQRRTIARGFAGALGALTLLSLAAGWIVAGRALRPIARITATARRVAAGERHERIAANGPADELKELADTFDAMLDRLDAAFAAQQRFVASASHELRTPLAMMRAEIDATLDDPRSGEPELRAMAAVVAAAVERTERLIGALLLLARSEQPLAARHRVDLAELVEAVLEPLQPEIVRLELDVELRPQPACVGGDPALLESLVNNLLENAVRYNRPGGRLAVATSISGGRALLELANTGAVVLEEDAPALFEPFRRLDGSRSRDSGGAGLGLSIARAIVVTHGGEINAQPHPGGGLTVAVSLPAP